MDIQKTGDSTIGAKLDLQVIDLDLDYLRKRINRLQKMVVNTQSSTAHSQLNEWNELSGYGIANIIHNERKSKLSLINRYAEQITFINETLKQQRGKMSMSMS
jgi:hypothetical protein